MSTIKTETLSTPSNATVPVDTVVNGTAKAWVNFNGTGTVAIRRAFNVSSITDRATGRYTVNFTTAMPDNDYSAICIGDSDGYMYIYEAVTTTSSVGVDANNMSNAGTDRAQISVAIFS